VSELDELVAESGAIAPLQAFERVRAAILRLGDAGPLSEIVERAPAEAAAAVELDRVLLSRVDDGDLHAEALHGADVLSSLQEAPVKLGYPLIEGEMLRRRRAQIVTEADSDPSRQAFSDAMGWRSYVAAPIVLETRVIGFFHGDRAEGELRRLDLEALRRFAEGFALIYERAVLQRRLRIQRHELRQVASWADARISELSDGVIDLAHDREAADGDEPARVPAGASWVRDLLTRREIDVMEHMVRGETNADIARALVVSEGTVKFHVKNILRKLNASNRAEATSRYLRLAMRGGDPSR
jgi:LuxR family transcriptional regulator, regulator of acetate metabolism